MNPEDMANIQEILHILTECGAEVRLTQRPTHFVASGDPSVASALPGRGTLIIAFFDPEHGGRLKHHQTAADTTRAAD